MRLYEPGYLEVQGASFLVAVAGMGVGRGCGERCLCGRCLRLCSATRLSPSLGRVASRNGRGPRGGLDRTLFHGGLAQEAVEFRLGSSPISQEALCLHAQRPRPGHRGNASACSPLSRFLRLWTGPAAPHSPRAPGLPSFPRPSLRLRKSVTMREPCRPRIGARDRRLAVCPSLWSEAPCREWVLRRTSAPENA